jgi:hypothetical protein
MSMGLVVEQLERSTTVSEVFDFWESLVSMRVRWPGSLRCIALKKWFFEEPVGRHFNDPTMEGVRIGSKEWYRYCDQDYTVAVRPIYSSDTMYAADMRSETPEDRMTVNATKSRVGVFEERNRRFIRSYAGIVAKYVHRGVPHAQLPIEIADGSVFGLSMSAPCELIEAFTAIGGPKTSYRPRFQPSNRSYVPNIDRGVTYIEIEICKWLYFYDQYAIWMNSYDDVWAVEKLLYDYLCKHTILKKEPWV